MKDTAIMMKSIILCFVPIITYQPTDLTSLQSRHLISHTIKKIPMNVADRQIKMILITSTERSDQANEHAFGIRFYIFNINIESSWQ